MKLDELPTNEDWDIYDWDQTFGSTFRAGDLSGDLVADVTPERIVEVIAWHAESPEGYASLDFWALVRLNDGQYAISEAWADTSGWDCQSGAWWKVGTQEQCTAELSEVNRKQLSETTR